MRHSTVTTIKHRLKEEGLYRKVKVPFLQNLGAEMLVVTYADFNPAVTARARVQKTQETIEIYDELFFSVGETNNGFSLSFSKDFTSIAKINDVRTEVFAELGLLEKEYPVQVFFPFATSTIDRFLDFSCLLAKEFGIEAHEKRSSSDLFRKTSPIELSDTEKVVLYALVNYPTLKDKSISEKIGFSRHTVSNVRRKLEEIGLIRTYRIPNLKSLNFEILCFCHTRFNPNTPSDKGLIDLSRMRTPSTFFMATRKFESVALNAYRNYEEFKNENSETLRYLKENDFLAGIPLVRLYSIGRMIIIKDLVFAPFVRQLLGNEEAAPLPPSP